MLPIDLTRQVALLFANGPHLGSVRSGETSINRTFAASSPMAPELAAWLERRSSPPAWASFSYRRNCDPRDESSLVVQSWSVWERHNQAGPPVFCFDPKIALVADAKLPESIRPRWNRSLESSLPFFVNTGTPVITH